MKPLAAFHLPWRKSLLCVVIIGNVFIIIFILNQKASSLYTIKSNSSNPTLNNLDNAGHMSRRIHKRGTSQDYELHDTNLILDDNIIQSIHSINHELQTERAVCRKARMMGGIRSCSCSGYCATDGDKRVCFDADVLPSTPSCNVLSFGVGFDLSFDKSMTLYGCKVKAFDHTNYNITNMKHGPHLHALALGIADKENYSVLDVTFDKGKHHAVVNSVMLTYSVILKLLDSSVKDIYILKFDIEGYEWKVLKDILTYPKLIANVRQILLEVHLDELKSQPNQIAMLEKAKQILQVLSRLTELGFKVAHSQENEMGQSFVKYGGVLIPLYREILYIRK